MRFVDAIGRALLLAVLASCAGSSLETTETPTFLQFGKPHVTIVWPPSGKLVGGAPFAWVVGHASMWREERDQVDVVVVFDRSKRTKKRLDGGRGSWWSEWPGSNSRPPRVVEAQAEIVRNLMEGLDPEFDRIGLVAYSGDLDVDVPDAVTIKGLTPHYETIEDGLIELLDEGPQGMANLTAGMRLAAHELYGTAGAWSRAREDAHRLMLLLTDGRPTLPYQHDASRNEQMALRYAAKLGKDGVRIDTFVVGEPAKEDQTSLFKMAGVSAGRFAALPHGLPQGVSLPGLDGLRDLRVSNSRVQGVNRPVLRTNAGAYCTRVPLGEGLNRVEITAYADDESASAALELEFDAAAPPAALPPELQRICERTALAP